jgi:hypothetical protein
LATDDAGVQAVELRLHRRHQVGGDRVALLVEHRVDAAAADDLAHRRFAACTTASSGLRFSNR